jgi:hypothetical protein
MGTGKKEASRKVRQGKVGDGMANVKVKGENFYRYAYGIFYSSIMSIAPLRIMTANIVFQLCEESQNP